MSDIENMLCSHLATKQGQSLVDTSRSTIFDEMTNGFQQQKHNPLVRILT